MTIFLKTRYFWYNSQKYQAIRMDAPAIIKQKPPGNFPFLTALKVVDGIKIISYSQNEMVFGF